MIGKKDLIEQLIITAITDGSVLSKKQLQDLRKRSEERISMLKKVFWVALVIFNLMIWAPALMPIAENLRWTIGIGALITAIVFPIAGIRHHRKKLQQLTNCTQAPKRRNTDDAGRKYMDLVKKQGRHFIYAEYAALQGEPHPDH